MRITSHFNNNLTTYVMKFLRYDIRHLVCNVMYKVMSQCSAPLVYFVATICHVLPAQMVTSIRPVHNVLLFIGVPNQPSYHTPLL